MTRKDFVALAEAIRDCRNALIASSPETSRHLIHQITRSMALDVAKVCAGQNARFDKSRFLEACGMGPA
jgi:hypothetical protein